MFVFYFVFELCISRLVHYGLFGHVGRELSFVFYGHHTLYGVASSISWVVTLTTPLVLYHRAPPFSLGSHSLAGSFHPAFFLDFPSLGMRYIFFSVDQDGDYSFNVQFHDYYLLICGFIPFFIGDAVTVSFADCLE